MSNMESLQAEIRAATTQTAEEMARKIGMECPDTRTRRVLVKLLAAVSGVMQVKLIPLAIEGATAAKNAAEAAKKVEHEAKQAAALDRFKNAVFVSDRGTGEVARPSRNGYVWTNWGAFNRETDDGSRYIIGMREEGEEEARVYGTLADKWLLTATRCQGCVFVPHMRPIERDTAGNIIPQIVEIDGLQYLNLYVGLAVTPAQGDVSQFVEVIDQVWACGDAYKANKMHGYIAHNFRNMGQGNKLRWMPVARGIQGCGKGGIAETIADIFGMFGRRIDDPEDIIGRFADLGSLACRNYDEVLFGKDPRQRGRVRGLVTGKMMRVERKGVQSIQVPNRGFDIVTTNEATPVYQDEYERRFLVLECSKDYAPWRKPTPEQAEEQTRRVAFWKRFFERYNTTEGKAAVAWYYLHEWQPADGDWSAIEAPPSTEEGEDMGADNLPAIEKALLSWVWDGRLPDDIGDTQDGSRLDDEAERKITSKDLTKGVKNWVARNKERFSNVEVTDKALGVAMAKLFPDVRVKHGMHGNYRMMPPRPALIALLRKSAPCEAYFAGLYEEPLPDILNCDPLWVPDRAGMEDVGEQPMTAAEARAYRRGVADGRSELSKAGARA